MIRLYSKANCPFCDLAKNLLDETGVNYRVVRIDRDGEERDYLIQRGHRSVPQLYVGDTLFVENGYDGLKALGHAAILMRYKELQKDD